VRPSPEDHRRPGYRAKTELNTKTVIPGGTYDKLTKKIIEAVVTSSARREQSHCHTAATRYNTSSLGGGALFMSSAMRMRLASLPVPGALFNRDGVAH
jgi:hypothetical protein